ncbi:MAG: UDP-N-acetylmuramoyl-tripeptide--D-alanyl-D-alanine ligase [Bacteroidales bacterium]|nr:UDP-N-acetylmuramoyl-tripeptide--D-alanyl-D-alanine ligase [Bacteroidales bacterium]
MEDISKIYELYKRAYTVTTDSRCITKDSVFVALKGEHFDGNDFARKAAEDGIAACVIADRQDLPQHERLFVVEDSLKTLQQLAKHHRENLDIPVIGITGTNGKTTTKELISAVLTKKYNIIYTQGNFNNHLGVPLTLLRIKPETEIAVVEMGANHPGEIRQLAEIAQPTIGIITNIGRAHLEGFGSYEEIIKTKFELYQYVHEHEGMLFVSKDDRLLMDLSGDMPKITYGGNSNSTINGDFVSANPFLKVSHCWHEFDTKLIGKYNFSNVMAAIAIGCRFGIDLYDIHDAISAYTPTNGRSQLVETQKNRVILDAYNANPTSMELAVRNFRNICKEDNLLILGDMRELGADSEKEHTAICELIGELGFNDVIFVGQEFKKVCRNSSFLIFDNVEDLCKHIENHPIEGKDILVKGSNSVKLWEVVKVI